MSKRASLTKRQLQKELKSIPPEWKVNSAETTLTAVFEQPDYITGLVAIARVVVQAELLQHHPDITYTYSQVKIKTTTHETKSLTKKDFDLVRAISKVFST